MSDLPLSTMIACGAGLVALPLAFRWDRRAATVELPAQRVDGSGLLFIAVALLLLLQVLLFAGLRAVAEDRIVLGRVLLGVPLVVCIAMAVKLLPYVVTSKLTALRAIAAGLVAVLAALPLVYGTAWLMTLLFGDQPAQQLVSVLAKRETGWREIAFVAVVLAPVSEELVFRGFFYPTLRRMRGAPFGLIASSVLFGIVHFDPWTAIFPLFVFGLVLARLMEKTGSYLACVTAHVAFNALTVGTVLLSESTSL